MPDVLVVLFFNPMELLKMKTENTFFIVVIARFVVNRDYNLNITLHFKAKVFLFSFDALC